MADTHILHLCADRGLKGMGTLCDRFVVQSVRPSVSDKPESQRNHPFDLGLRHFFPRGVQVSAKDSIILREYTPTPNPLIINEMTRKPGDNDAALNPIDFDYSERSR